MVKIELNDEEASYITALVNTQHERWQRVCLRSVDDLEAGKVGTSADDPVVIHLTRVVKSSLVSLNFWCGILDKLKRSEMGFRKKMVKIGLSEEEASYITALVNAQYKQLQREYLRNINDLEANKIGASDDDPVVVHLTRIAEANKERIDFWSGILAKFKGIM